MQFIELPKDICVKFGDEVVRPRWLAVDENMRLHAFDVQDGKCSEVQGEIVVSSQTTAERIHPSVVERIHNALSGSVSGVLTASDLRNLHRKQSGGDSNGEDIQGAVL